MIIITPLLERGLREVLMPGANVVDIGGGLRLAKNKGNRYDPALSWALPLMKETNYRVLDVVDTYHPDIVGDIHKLPFTEGELDGLFCMSILEHVEDPFLACREMHRVLKSGGKVLIYVPFLFYYHAEKGYYKDYWRFTEDSIRLLLKDFSSVQVEPVRGAIETVINLFPGGSRKFFAYTARFLDRVFGKTRSKQTGGFHVLAVK